MKRDMDLIRDLLLKLEAFPTSRGAIYHLTAEDDELRFDNYDPDLVDYHLALLLEVDFVERVSGGRPMEGIMFRRLTWAGHDFLDSVRDPVIWNRTKDGALAAGGFTVDLLAELAKGFIKKQIEARTGIAL